MKEGTTTDLAPQDGGGLATQGRPEFNPIAMTMPDPSALKKATVSEYQSNPLYHEFQQDEEVTGFFLGFTGHECPDRQTGELRTLNAAVFLTKENKLRKNAAALFTDYFKNKLSGHPFHVKMTGIKPKNGKNIQQFEFHEVML